MGLLLTCAGLMPYLRIVTSLPSLECDVLGALLSFPLPQTHALVVAFVVSPVLSGDGQSPDNTGTFSWTRSVRPSVCGWYAIDLFDSVRNVLSRRSRFCRNKLRSLGKSIHDGENGIIAFGAKGKCVVTSIFTDSQGLVGIGSGSNNPAGLCRRVTSLTNITTCCIPPDQLIHFRPI